MNITKQFNGNIEVVFSGDPDKLILLGGLYSGGNHPIEISLHIQLHFMEMIFPQIYKPLKNISFTDHPLEFKIKLFARQQSLYSILYQPKLVNGFLHLFKSQKLNNPCVHVFNNYKLEVRKFLMFGQDSLYSKICL